jgi:hypothetical protein
MTMQRSQLRNIAKDGKVVSYKACSIKEQGNRSISATDVERVKKFEPLPAGSKESSAP